nr:endoplasmic reticulum protein [Cryptococcus depauperatus CBS 7841]
MGLLHILAYAGGIAAFLFVTLSLASGLLWLAELIEEHSKYAKIIGMRAIYTIIALHTFLYFTDSLPLSHIVFSITCHLVYLSNFSSSWPFISLISPRFILSCVLVVADHFLWFFYFASVAHEAKRYRGPQYRYGGQQANATDTPSFGDVAAFFAICVWFVPLYLFLSLSANDNALPSFDSSSSSSPSSKHVNFSSSTPQTSRSSSTSLIKSALLPLLSLLPRIRSRSKKNEEGLIAPRTPTKGSPLSSPALRPHGYSPWGQEPAPGTASGYATPTRSLTPDRLGTPPPTTRSQSGLLVGGESNNLRRVSSGRPTGIASRMTLGMPLDDEGELSKHKAN